MYSDYTWLPGLDSADAFAAFIAIYFGVLLLMNLYSIVVYILQSLGLYTIANRRGIHHPWLAWLPVCNMWIMGSISDQYQYVCKGKVTNRRKVLIGLMISMYVLMIVFFVGFLMAMFNGIAAEFDFSAGDTSVIVPIIVTVVAYIVMFIIAVVLTVYQYICTYDLFVSCSPNNAVAFLVLSIFFSFLLPFFIFGVRKKDLGMPPRKPQPPVQNTWQPSAPNPAAMDWPPVQSAEEPAVPVAEESAVQEQTPEE